MAGSWNPAAPTHRITLTGVSGLMEEVKGIVRWKHEATYTQKAGLVKATCVCGWQSGKEKDYAAARKLYDAHVGLSERKGSG
jgi:hypothetical protein